METLPDDWTDLELDLRIADETRYVDAAVILSLVNAQPYSRADWHWRINVAHRFGHAAAAETVREHSPSSMARASAASFGCGTPRRAAPRSCSGGAGRTASGGTSSGAAASS